MCLVSLKNKADEKNGKYAWRNYIIVKSFSTNFKS